MRRNEPFSIQSARAHRRSSLRERSERAVRRRWALERGSSYLRAQEADLCDHQTLYGERDSRRTPHARRKHPRLAHQHENEQLQLTPNPRVTHARFWAECDSAPPAYPSLLQFSYGGRKKSRAGDAVGRRAERAGVPEWLLFIVLFSRKRFAQRVE